MKEKLSLGLKNRTLIVMFIFTVLGIFLIPGTLQASQSAGIPTFSGFRFEFILFGLTLAGVAIFNRQLP